MQVQADGNGEFQYAILSPAGRGTVFIKMEELSGDQTGCVAVTFDAPNNRLFDFDATLAGPTQDPASAPTDGTTGDPATEAYHSVLPTREFEPGSGYGWVVDASSELPSGGGFNNGDIPNDVDAGQTAASEAERQEDKLRDGHQGNGPSTFRVELQPGLTYAVSVTLGSQAQHNNITLDANGTPIFTDLDLLAGEYRQTVFDVAIGPNGLLDLDFDSVSGLPFFVVNSLEIREVSQLAPVTFTGSTTASGTVTVTGTAPAGSLLTIAVDSGSSDQGAVGTDSDGSYLDNQVIVDGSGNFSFTYSTESGATPGSIVMPTFIATAIDGSARGTGTVNVTVPEAVGGGGAATQRFDFNNYSNSSPTAVGFVGVDPLDTNIADGFAWAAIPSALDAGFATGVTTPNLYRDGALSFGAPSTFRIDTGLTTGDVIDVRVYYGSPYFPTPGGTVTLEGTTMGTMLARGAGEFGLLTISGATVGADGILDVTFAGGWWVAGIDVSNTGNLPPAAPLMFAGEAGEGAATLSASALQTITTAAITRLAAAGEDVSGLADIEFQITDLNDQHALGLAGGRVILIDDDGFGHGWFVDATPLIDEEFTATTGSELITNDSTVSDQVDLLTVVMHELGHILGYGDLDADTNPHELMTANLSQGIRRLPKSNAVAANDSAEAGTASSAASESNGVSESDPAVSYGETATTPVGVSENELVDDESQTAAAPTSNDSTEPNTEADAYDTLFEEILDPTNKTPWDLFETPTL